MLTPTTKVDVGGEMRTPEDLFDSNAGRIGIVHGKRGGSERCADKLLSISNYKIYDSFQPLKRLVKSVGR